MPTQKPEEKGTMTFYHPAGAHDDQLWALALAAYATKEKESEPNLAVIRKQATHEPCFKEVSK